MIPPSPEEMIRLEEQVDQLHDEGRITLPAAALFAAAFYELYEGLS